MASAFSKVYEEWLQENSPTKAPSKNNVKSEDRSGNDPDGLSDLIDSDDTTTDAEDSSVENSSEESEASSTQKQWLGKAAGHASDTAPFLIDDEEEEDYFEDNCRFEEPPVLEPVSKPMNCKHGFLAALNSPQRQQKGKVTHSVKNYSRESKSQSRSPEKKKCKLKKTDSGNLFDKMTNMVFGLDDVPPALVPSSPTPQCSSPPADKSSNIKNPSCSPDFRAMEADSTSELSVKPPLVNNNSMAGDMVVECDSTCMLGGSPPVVSPASMSVSESEARDQGEGVADTEAGSPAEQARGTNFTGERVSDCFAQEDQRFQSKISTLSTLGLYPEMNKSHTKVSSQSVASTSHADHSSIEPALDGPPILCRISASTTCLQKQAKKRSYASTCLSDGKSSVVTSPYFRDHDHDMETSSPPLLPLMDRNSSPTPQSSKVVSTKLKQRSSYSRTLREQHESRNKKRQQIQSSAGTVTNANIIPHSKRIPVVKIEPDVKHLPETLQQFVIASCQLSALQSSIHSLVLGLFPQLKEEVNSMTPESPQFRTLLTDLTESLQLDTIEESKPPLTMTIKCKRDPKTSTSLTAQISHHIDPPLIPKTSFSLPSIPSQVSADDLCSPQSSKRRTRQSLANDPLSMNVIPRLSNLKLDNREAVISCSRVSMDDVLHFSVLCCDFLQLLLPDLPISLCNELAEKPSDLLTFVDNMLAANKRSRIVS